MSSHIYTLVGGSRECNRACLYQTIQTRTQNGSEWQGSRTSSTCWRVSGRVVFTGRSQSVIASFSLPGAPDDDGMLDSSELENQTAALPESHAAAIKQRMHTLRSTIK